MTRGAHLGMDLAGLLGIEYVFHFTLIISAVIVARFFLTVVWAPADSPG